MIYEFWNYSFFLLKKFKEKIKHLRTIVIILNDFLLKKKQIKLNKYKLLIIIIQRKNTQLFYIRFKILAKNDKKVYI